jgi:hypothetical protein
MSEETQVTAPPSRARYLVLIWFVIVGYFAGGMIGVAVAKLVGVVTHCTAAEGFPACNFEPYFQVGTAIGAILLPALVAWRMRQGAAAGRNPERG